MAYGLARQERDGTRLRRGAASVGLSQHELAHLLGCSSGAKVSRYEHFQRVPSLKTAIAYEIVFRAPLESLLPGLYAQVRARIAGHAQTLVAKVGVSSVSFPQDKLAFLKALTSVSTDDT